jgi:hypothetical protein
LLESFGVAVHTFPVNSLQSGHGKRRFANHR